MSDELKGKTAVVTGSSSGIGRAIAEKLGGAGAHVFLSGRTPEAMEVSKKNIEAAGGTRVGRCHRRAQARERPIARRSSSQ